MAKHGSSGQGGHGGKSKSVPQAPQSMGPSKDEMLRMQAEHVVRDAIGKTPIFKQEVARVMRTMKTMEHDTVKRFAKGGMDQHD